MQTKSKFNYLLAALFLALGVSTQAADLIPLGSSWKYVLGTNEASSPSTAWREIAYNDGPWSSGIAPIGYDTGGAPGTAPIVTVLPDPRTAGNPVWNSAYYRKTFNVANPAGVTELLLTVYVDDGAVAWVNGIEVGRINVPDGELAYNGAALVADETRTMATTNIASLLVAGNNVVAVHAFNGPAASSDCVFEAVLTATLDEPPTVLSLDPPASGIVTELTVIDVIFSENVTGVDAGDLRINDVPATGMTVISPREYVFSFPQPPTGAVSVAWALVPGIVDQDQAPDAFVPGAGWAYTLDPNAVPSTARITEFMTDNENGIRDEDGVRSDWIEVYNPGPIDINLGGWFLTDTTNNLTKWRFPSINLAANKYLLVWASEKNRTNPTAPLHTNFKLSKDAGYLALISPATNEVSVFNPYPAQLSDVSYGRDRVDPNLVGYFVTPTPGVQNTTSGTGFAAEPVFSLENGIYTNNSLTLTLTATAGHTIRYTFNGSEPTNNSPIYSAPITFTTNMMIKARAYSTVPGVWPSPVVARNFILLDASARDFNSNLPLLIISTHGKTVPQGIAPGGARPRGTFVSIDTFRGRSSIQGKTEYHGLGQFEIVGQTSAGFAKQPIRLELNDELGNDRSASLLGMPAEADWNLRNPHNDKGLFNDFLGYEMWEDMGHYSCRRRFVEVFFETTSGGKLTYPGDYYGVMVLLERIEIGDDRVNVAKLSAQMTNEPAITGGYIIKKDKDSAGDTAFVTAGGAGHSSQTLKFHDPKPREITVTQSNYIRNFTRQFETSMYAANWTNATGTNHYSYYVDVDQFVDQHLHVEFTKQIDGYRISSFYSKDRNGKLKPEPVWDWNLSFGNANYLKGGMTNGWYWADEAEGMNSGNHIWLRRMVYGAAAVSPSGTANGPGDPDFRQKITDRWDVMRTNVFNGPRVVARINELEALLAEAAARNWSKYPGILNTYQWPNPEGSTPTAGNAPMNVDYTQPTSAAIISEIRKWVTGRFNWMDAQFLRAPTLSTNGLTVFISAPVGTIYYTLDGTDPRLPGGGISPVATQYTGPITLAANARVVARALTASTTPLWTPWSPPVAATYVLQTPKLVITEIMYHPHPPGFGSPYTDEDFEYLEVKNVGSTPLNVNGYTLSGGIDFTFPNRVLAAGERVVVVKNQTAFNSRYPGASAAVVGEYTGNLANEGNRIILQGHVREPILDFSYDDKWYPVTDGFGFSLVIINDNGTADTWGLGSSWRPSGALHGSPGTGDSATSFPQVVINEALTHSDPPPPSDTIELRNLSDSPADIGNWFLTDDFRIPKKYRIAAGTTIPANGYITFNEGQFNTPTNAPTSFALSSSGDEVYLFSGDSDGNLTGYSHGFDFGPALNGVTFGRHVLSTGEERFVSQSSATLGTANSGPQVGPIVISEIMYHPPDVLVNGAYWDNTEDEFIELQNISNANAPLYDLANTNNTWRLRDAVDYTFPSGAVLPPGGYALVVGFDPNDAAALAAFVSANGVPANIPIYGPWQGKLDNSEESVELVQPGVPDPVGSPTAGQFDYILVDRVKYQDTAPWPTGLPDGLGASLGRIDTAAYGNDPGNWRTSPKTPGAPIPSGGIPPAIVSQPVNTSGIEGQSASFTVNATGSALGYIWTFNGKPVSGASSPVLVLNNLNLNQAGTYGCFVFNSAGSVQSSNATLTVRMIPRFTQQPLGTNVYIKPDTKAAPSTNVTFSVAVTSSEPPVSYQWRFNGVDIPGATGSSYTVVDVQLDEEGDYSCAITDGTGTIYSADARLYPLISTAITQGLVSPLFSAAGASVTFSVSASGNPFPFSYEWRRGSVTVASNVVYSTTDYYTFLSTNRPFVTNAYRVIVRNLANSGLTANSLATNITLPDFDQDGIIDQYEVSLGLNTNNAADALGDLDLDGMNNKNEVTAGTDPANSASYLKTEQSVVTGDATVQFASVSNRTYTIQYSDSLSSTAWSKLTDVPARRTNFVHQFADPTWTTNRFYRVVTPRQP